MMAYIIQNISTKHTYSVSFIKFFIYDYKMELFNRKNKIIHFFHSKRTRANLNIYDVNLHNQTRSNKILFV